MAQNRDTWTCCNELNVNCWMRLVLAKACWSADCDMWKTGKLDCEEVWVHMFNHFNNQNISYQFLTSLCLCSAYQAFLLLLKECFH